MSFGTLERAASTSLELALSQQHRQYQYVGVVKTQTREVNMQAKKAKTQARKVKTQVRKTKS